MDTISEEYERDWLKSFVAAHSAGEADAIDDAPYNPMRVHFREHRDVLNADAYRGGWIDAKCQKSTWRRWLYVAGWKLSNWAVGIGR